MADEIDVINLDGDIHYYTVADGTAIQKGTLMVLGSDPRTAVAHSAIDQIPLGVLVEDKVASDGQTRVGIRVRGIIDIVAKAAVVLGDYVKPSATANQIMPITCSPDTPSTAVSNASFKATLGRCLETATAAERVHVILMCG